MLPQNPQALFVKNTVMEDLLEILPGKMSREERERKPLPRQGSAVYPSSLTGTPMTCPAVSSRGRHLQRFC